MQKITTLLLCTLCFNILFGQSNYDKFKVLFKTNDTAKIKAFIKQWEAASPNDPELYTSAINFYFINSRQEILSLDKQQVKPQSFKITDSAGNTTGYLSSNAAYNIKVVSMAINYANTGINKFPDRLDIRFGKCYMLQQIGDYENFTQELIKAIDYSAINKNNWLWTENKKQEGGEAFFLLTIQDYLKQLYDTQNDSLLTYVKQIGEATIKYYKNSVEILTTTAVACLLTNNYSKAIEYLKQAETLNPKDYIVLSDIAQAYKQTGDKENAIKYYKLVEKYGDESTKQLAKKNIKELKK